MLAGFSRGAIYRAHIPTTPSALLEIRARIRVLSRCVYIDVYIAHAPQRARVALDSVYVSNCSAICFGDNFSLSFHFFFAFGRACIFRSVAERARECGSLRLRANSTGELGVLHRCI